MVGKPFVISFCKLFQTWPCTTFNSIPVILNLRTNRNIALIYSVTINLWTKKQRIVHGQGTSNITFSTINSSLMFAGCPNQSALLCFHFDQATCNVNKSDVSASRNSSQNAGNHENLYSIRGVKSNIQLSTVFLNKITKGYKKNL